MVSHEESFDSFGTIEHMAKVRISTSTYCPGVTAVVLHKRFRRTRAETYDVLESHPKQFKESPGTVVL